MIPQMRMETRTDTRLLNRRRFIILFLVIAVCVSLLALGAAFRYTWAQEAACAILSKHVPHRGATMEFGQCHLWTGAGDDVWTWESLDDYGHRIIKNESATP